MKNDFRCETCADTGFCHSGAPCPNCIDGKPSKKRGKYKKRKSSNPVGRPRIDPDQGPLVDWVSVGLTKETRGQVEELRALFAADEKADAVSLSRAVRASISMCHRALVTPRATP